MAAQTTGYGPSERCRQCRTPTWTTLHFRTNMRLHATIRGDVTGTACLARITRAYPKAPMTATNAYVPAVAVRGTALHRRINAAANTLEPAPNRAQRNELSAAELGVQILGLAPVTAPAPAATTAATAVAPPTAATPTAARTGEYPAAPKDPSIVEKLHGRQVADTFRPLENLDAPETVNWWKAQNQRTQAFLSGAGTARQSAIKWHSEIRNYTREGMEATFGGAAFFTRQAGLAAQPTYYVRATKKGTKPRVLIDPKTLSKDGTVSVSSMDPSPNGKLVAYTLSEAGSDMLTMKFRDSKTGRDVYEELKGLRFTSATWDVDGKAVIYAKPLPEAEAKGGKHFGLYRHVLGQPQSKDTQLYKRTDVENSFVSGFRLHERDPMLFVSIGSGTNPESGLYVQAPGSTKLLEILPPQVAAIQPFHREGNFVYAVTDLKAPRNRIVKINLKDPKPDKWETIVEQSNDPANNLLNGFVAGGKLMVTRSIGGADAMEVRSLLGKQEATVPLPIASKVRLGQVRPESKNFELLVSSYLSPGNRFRYSVADNKLTPTKKSGIARDLTEIAEVERVFATSKDGTKVPMWVIKPKGMKLDGTAPALLYGYGGFNNPLEPGFSFSAAHWVENGGVYVVANLRGGGEFGRDWYDQGRLKNKQNTFDDFAACARELVKLGFTSPKKLAISGASNGGLLTAATSQQNPELFGAVISGVPVTDMLRFHTNNYGAAWKSDYGDPTVKEDFDVSIKYSPLHNVRPASEGKYPPTLILTGDHDDRVAPWHAMKWAATRFEQGHDANTFLRVDERAGHGAGKPTKKVIEEEADKYAFLVQALGIEPTPAAK